MTRPRRLGLLLGLLTILVVEGGGAGLALAQPAPRSPARQAEDHAARGEKAYRARRYAESAREFEEAYQLSGQPSHLYNMAQAHRQAGNRLMALQCYRGYLQRMPEAPNRADIERRIAELEVEMSAAPPVVSPPGSGYPPAGDPAAQAPVYAPDGQPIVPPGYPPGTPPPGGQWYGTTPGAQPPPYPGYPPGQAPPQIQTELPPGAREHDGLFLRLQLGFGYMSTDLGDSTLSGGSPTIALAAGYSLTRSITLYAEGYSGAVSDPTSESAAGTLELTGTQIAHAGFGAGVAVFINPANFYVSGTLSFSQVTFTLGDTEAESDLGPGFLLSVGKEWWVGNQLGLGASLQFQGSVVDDTDGSSISTAAFGLSLSLTFN
jgi:hypothetical protein